MVQNYVISLSSVPPRFDRLGPVVRALLAQSPAPEAVLLCLAPSYHRFPERVECPDVPDGAELIWAPDIGPGMKAVTAARHLIGRDVALIYCDDDWLVQPDWAATLLAKLGPKTAATGQGFRISRLGHTSQAQGAYVDVAQGFSGVAVRPEWLALASPPDSAALRMVDDIWLSAHLASGGVQIRGVPAARDKMQPAYSDVADLQSEEVFGMTREQANRACAQLMSERHGIWSRTASAARPKKSP